MDSLVPFAIAQMVGMVAGGILTHLAVKTYQEKTTITVSWGENDVAQLQAPDDILKYMYTFSTIKHDLVDRTPYDSMCYLLHSLYANLEEYAQNGGQVNHEQLYFCRNLIERVISFGSALLRQVGTVLPEMLDDMQGAYDQLEQALEKEMYALECLYKQSMLM